MLPNNPKCLRVRRLDGCTKREWSIEGNQLLTNRGPRINIIYSRLEPRVALWDVQFRNAFAWSLAASLGEIVKDEQVIATAAGKARDALAEAFPVDAEESGEDEPPMFDIIAARF